MTLNNVMTEGDPVKRTPCGPASNEIKTLDQLLVLMDDAKIVVGGLITRLESAEEERARLEGCYVELLDAVRWHHSQKFDDLCHEDDNRIYKAAGLPPRDNHIGDQEAMLKNCQRFINQRCQPGGDKEWTSYVELELKLEETMKEMQHQKSEVVRLYKEIDGLANENKRLSVLVKHYHSISED